MIRKTGYEPGDVGVLVCGGEGVDDAAHTKLLLHLHRDEVDLWGPGRRKLGRKVVDVYDGEDEISEPVLRRVCAGISHLKNKCI